MAFEIKRHDTLPAYVVALSDTNGPIALTAATSVQLLMRVKGTAEGATTINTPMVIADPVASIVSYQWQPADTATPGDYDTEFEIHFPGGKQTVPTDGYLTVTVNDDIGDAP